MNRSFEHVSILEYRLKAANDKIMAYESGERYTQQQAKYRKALHLQELQIKKLTAELAQAHSDIVSIRNQWFEVFKDFQKATAKREAASFKESKALKKSYLKQKALEILH